MKPPNGKPMTRAEEKAAMDAFIAQGKMVKVQTRTVEEFTSATIVSTSSRAVEVLEAAGIKVTARGDGGLHLMYDVEGYGPHTRGGLCALANTLVNREPLKKKGRIRGRGV